MGCNRARNKQQNHATILARASLLVVRNLSKPPGRDQKRPEEEETNPPRAPLWPPQAGLQERGQKRPTPAPLRPQPKWAPDVRRYGPQPKRPEEAALHLGGGLES